jgi:hypothetical protein
MYNESSDTVVDVDILKRIAIVERTDLNSSDRIEERISLRDDEIVLLISSAENMLSVRPARRDWTSPSTPSVRASVKTNYGWYELAMPSEYNIFSVPTYVVSCEDVIQLHRGIDSVRAAVSFIVSRANSQGRLTALTPDDRD